jgi:RNA 3'-terminal phosphate cyclase (ATP)
MTDLLVIDGSRGEGGGQILRTALSIATLMQRPVRLERIRARRPRPGLAAQHLAAVRAMAAVSGARVSGDGLGSLSLEFTPTHPPQAGAYAVDIGAARPGGSAGALTLVLQAMLLPLALTAGRSTIVLTGGTHVPWSPSFDFVRNVWLPTLGPMGITAEASLCRWGFYPAGRGEVHVTIEGSPRARALPTRLCERGALLRVSGRAVTSGLAAHVGERMVSRARAQLAAAGVAADLDTESVDAASPGAGLFTTAEYACSRAGFDALGRRGVPAERVADNAIRAFFDFDRAGAAVEAHLADQLLLAMACADGPCELRAERSTPHLVTNAWVIEQFGLARVAITTSDVGPAHVAITPQSWSVT